MSIAAWKALNAIGAVVWAALAVSIIFGNELRALTAFIGAAFVAFYLAREALR